MTGLDHLGRRPVLGAGLAVAAAGLLSACGDDAEPSTAPTQSETSAPQPDPSTSTAAGGAVLVALADVPVGGAVSAKTADGSPIIVAQPTAGQVVGFSAACTHQGCTVAPTGNRLDCPCHGSVFDALTGQNLEGPAPSPLAAFAVTLQGTDVVAG